MYCSHLTDRFKTRFNHRIIYAKHKIESDMVSELIIGTAVAFAVLVLASYIGTKLALRSFFGPEYVDPVYKNFTLEEENAESSLHQKDR